MPNVLVTVLLTIVELINRVLFANVELFLLNVTLYDGM